MKKILFILLGSFLILGACSQKQISVDDLVESFKEEDLSVKDLKQMKKDDYGAAPMKAETGKIFEVQNDKNARILMFKNKEDLKDTKEYYDKLGEESSIFFSHTYAKGNYLIQMNGDISDSKFKEYKSVMKQIIED